MSPVTRFLASVLATASAPATPLGLSSSFITVPINKSHGGALLNSTGLIQQDQRRIASFKAGAEEGNAPIVNVDVSYYAATQVNHQTFNLLVDTGSANTWVGDMTPFDGTGATDTGHNSQIMYGSGNFSGVEYQTTMTLGGLTAKNQYVGVASQPLGITGLDGIIAFGPVDLTKGTVSGLDTVPTFLDTLVAQQSITSEILGVAFAPITSSATTEQNGALDIGGEDPSRYTGAVSYTDITTSEPYRFYWGVDVGGLDYGSRNSLLGNAAAIVDTGTSLIILPHSAFSGFLSATGCTVENGNLPSCKTKPTQDLVFKIGGASLTLTPAQYLVPEAQYETLQLNSGQYYPWLSDGGTNTEDVNFILGQKFMEHYYTIFDTANKRIGFAKGVSG